MKVQIILDVEIADDLKNGVIGDPETVTNDLFNFLCDDPDDLFPEITVVSGADWKLS
jgi:hypothetical protein